MKKFLVNFVGVNGLVFESFASESELNQYRESGKLVCFRKLSHGEIMEIANYGF